MILNSYLCFYVSLVNDELDRIFKRSPETFHKFQSEKEFAAKLAKLEMEDRRK